MKKLVLFILIAGTISVYGQSDRGTSELKHGLKMRKAAFKGHAYLLNDWVSGFAVDLNGRLTEEKLLNYDIFQNKLTYKMETANDDVMVINTNDYSGFMLNDAVKNKNYLFTKLQPNDFVKPKKETKFYEIVSAPTKEVILESIKILKDPNASGWSSSRLTTKNAEFELKENVYVLNKDQQYVKVAVSKGSILKAFKDKKAELLNYIKSENLSFDKPEDLIPVVQYYHSL